MCLTWLATAGSDPLQRDILDIQSQLNTHAAIKYGDRELYRQSSVFGRFLIHEKHQEVLTRGSFRGVGNKISHLILDYGPLYKHNKK